jgi:CubicO group peptidase (beta-lactamase class C family)
MAFKNLLLVALCAAMLTAPGPLAAQQPPASAADTDPVKLGWMQGSPPSPEKRIAFEDGSFVTFPRIRWSFAHYRELFPTARIAKGPGRIARLPLAIRPELADLTFLPKGKTVPVNWVTAFDEGYGDAILVLHRGRIVFEKYNGVMNADQPHIGFSLTKSLFGTLAEMMVAEGTLDERKTVAAYLPELASSGVGDATLRQVLDMTTSLDYNEDAPDADIKMRGFVLAS